MAVGGKLRLLVENAPSFVGVCVVPKFISPSDKAEKKSVRSGRNRGVHGGCAYENAMSVFRREDS